MKLEVLAASYTGAHFRGMEDASDNQPQLLLIEGEEKLLATYLAQRYLYGLDDDGPFTIEALIDANLSLAYDGCGAITFIKDLERNRILFNGDTHGIKHYVPYADGNDEREVSWRSVRRRTWPENQGIITAKDIES